MEKKVLTKPAVADVLREHYIEARLHTDAEIENIDRIREVQKRFAESVANPVYVTVDPTTEARHSKFEGATVTAADEKRFVSFLEEPTKAVRPGEKVSKRD